MGYSRGCSGDSIFLPAHWPDVNAMTAIQDVIRAHHRPKGSLLYGGIQPTQKQIHTSRECGTATPAHGDHTNTHGGTAPSQQAVRCREHTFRALVDAKDVLSSPVELSAITGIRNGVLQK